MLQYQDLHSEFRGKKLQSQDFISEFREKINNYEILTQNSDKKVTITRF